MRGSSVVRRPWPRFVLVAVVVFLAGAAACGDETDLEGDRARIELGDRTITIDVEECGTDGESILVFGSDQTATLQLFVQLEGGEPVERASGVTVDLPGIGQVGAGDPDLLGTTDVGSIEAIRVIGDRVELDARTSVMAGGPEADRAAGDLSVEARCPAEQLVSAEIP